MRGVCAIVTDVGCGMRWTRRRRRRAVPKRTAKSCGPDAPTLVSSFAEAISARRRWQESPVTEESAKETVKTIRVRECRVSPVNLAVTTLVCFVFFAREAAGATGTRHSPRPLLFEAVDFLWHDSGAVRRGNARVCVLDVIARSGATKQSTLACGPHGLLRFARNDDSGNRRSSWLFEI